LRLLAAPRILVNPSLHAVILIRAALATPNVLFALWRNVLITKHSIDLQWGCRIGPGLVLTHPLGVVLGGGVTIGSNVQLAHNVSIGLAHVPQPAEPLEYPTIGDDVVIYPNSVIVGGIHVGAGSVIGANSYVDQDLPPNTVFRRRPEFTLD
jgi:serine O-acetyltransferase